jgi:hypothetical protein
VVGGTQEIPWISVDKEEWRGVGTLMSGQSGWLYLGWLEGQRTPLRGTTPHDTRDLKYGFAPATIEDGEKRGWH